MARHEESNPLILINYLYYGSLFALLILLSIGNLTVRENLGTSHFFFFFYSIGQASLEVLGIILIGLLIRSTLPNTCFKIYIGLTFLCCLCHFVDFLTERVMNFSLFETIAFAFDESFENFLLMLEASGLPLWLWAVLFILSALIPVLGCVIYRCTGWLAQKKPFGVKLDVLAQALFCVPIALFLWDFSASRLLSWESHRSLVKTLPWKVTFLSPHTPMLALPHLLPEPKNEQQVLTEIEQAPIVPLEKRPNIYLFVVESLRADTINSEVAPALTEFRTNHLSSPLSLSCANSTDQSWFAIFHSNYAYYKSTLKQNQWQSGSPALNYLKKLGYELQVYSAANLAYYGMDELIFGKDLHLLTSLHAFPHVFPKEAWASDTETLDAFAKQIPRPNSGQCRLFFWDATHFDYSWPKHLPARFSPISSEINYFRAYQSKESIEQIKNRYRNAVHFIDGLFQRFLTLIQDDPDALVVFTGDHGEEFFEHGHLFHLSQLCDVQTQVPIYFKLPKRPASMPPLVSHLDIFPTLFEALGQDCSKLPFMGQSLYKENRWPYAVMTRFNASRTPYEFCLHNGRHKLIARFSNRSNIFESPMIEIHSIKTCTDGEVCDCRQNLEAWILSEFGTGLETLFPPKR